MKECFLSLTIIHVPSACWKVFIAKLPITFSRGMLAEYQSRLCEVIADKRSMLLKGILAGPEMVKELQALQKENVPLKELP